MSNLSETVYYFGLRNVANSWLSSPPPAKQQKADEFRIADCELRISVSPIVNLLANGLSTDQIIAEYPDLEAIDIEQSLRYAAWTAEDVVYERA